MDTRNETLGALLERYAGDNDVPRHVPRILFEDALRRSDDPLHVLPYLADIGIEVRTIHDLLKIGDDQSEEEVLSFLVEEGVAVVMVNDGNWLLFEGSAP